MSLTLPGPVAPRRGHVYPVFDQSPGPAQLWRELVQTNGFVIGLALACGATAVLESWLPAVAFVGIAFVVAALYFPALPIAFAFVGVLLDARGVTAVKVLGVPLTLSKVSVLMAIGAHFANSTLGKRTMGSWTPITTPIFLVIMTMVTSLITSMVPSMGYVDLVGVVMLSILVHLLYQAIPEEHVPLLTRFMAVAAILVMASTLVGQRKGVLSGTLDYAWHQRTSGAYGDPNAWSTSLLLINPLLMGALAADRHWSSRLLLIGLLGTFPACIMQSVSRAGLVAMLAISPGLIWILRKEKTILMVGGAMMLTILPFIMDVEAAMMRYMTLFDPTMEADLGHGSLTERKALLNAGIKIFLENPILGVGVGAFRVHASYVSAGEVWKIAHNTYLNVAAEQGIPGLLSHAWLGVNLVNAAWNIAMHGRSEYQRSIGTGFLMSLAAFGLMALTLNLATFAMAYFIIGLGLAVGRHSGAFLGRQPAPEALPTRRVAPGARA